MDHTVRFGFLCATGVLLGLLLLPVIPELGGGVILVVCALILMDSRLEPASNPPRDGARSPSAVRGTASDCR